MMIPKINIFAAGLSGALLAVSLLAGTTSCSARPAQHKAVKRPPAVHAAAPTLMPEATGPYTWHSVQLVAGGFVSGIVYSPAAKDMAYVRTDIGGAYRWDAAAGRWMPLLDWLGPSDWNLTGVESIGVDPTDARRVYLALGTYANDWAGNGAILRSSDGGRTWQRTDLPFKNGGNMDGRSTGERLAVDPHQNSVLFFGSRDNGLWRSADYGATWSQTTSFPVTGRTNGTGVDCVVFDSASGAAGRPTPTVYACVSQSGPGLYRSADAGRTWQAVPGQPGGGLLPHHAVLTRAGSLYLTYANGPGPNGVSVGAVWKLDTKTGAWTDISPVKTGAPGASGYAGLAVDSQRPDTLMVGTMDRWNPGDTLFRSTDGGLNWTDIGPRSVRDCSLSPWLTFGGAAPRFGWWIGALAIDPFRPGHVSYGTGATIWASADVTQADTGGATHWAVGADGIEETAVLQLVSPPAGAHLFSSMGDISSYRHDDLTVSPRDGMLKPVLYDAALAFAQNLPSLIARVGSGEGGKDGAFSTDGGTTWTAFGSQPPGAKGGGSVAVSADGAAFVWSPPSAPVSVSSDHGATWTPCAGVPAPLRLAADGSDARRVYGFDGATGMVYVSQDGGASFTAAASMPPDRNGKLIAAPGHAGDLWLADNGAVAHSTDGGATFIKLASVQNGHALGLGKAAPGRDYPSLYLLGTVGGTDGIFRSDDVGQTWARIDDVQHRYATARVIAGDPRIYGRVYVGANGRGILYGDPVTKP